MSWTIGLMVGLGVFLGLPVYLSYDKTVILIFIAVPAFLGSAYIGVTFAMAQGLVGLKMRAVAAAIVLFIINSDRLWASVPRSPAGSLTCCSRATASML